VSDEVHERMALLGHTDMIVREASVDNIFGPHVFSADIGHGDRWQRTIIPAAAAEDARRRLQSTTARFNPYWIRVPSRAQKRIEDKIPSGRAVLDGIDDQRNGFGVGWRVRRLPSESEREKVFAPG
jgi:hypothetical protein